MPEVAGRRARVLESMADDLIDLTAASDNEDDAADIAAKVSSADYQPARRQRTWQQVAPAVGADLVGDAWRASGC